MTASTLVDLVDLYAHGDPSRGPTAIHGIQARVQLREEVVVEYLDLLVEDVQLPPIGVIAVDAGDASEGCDDLLVWDGYHRLEAHRRAGRLQIEAILEPGTELDALRKAAGANADHGLRRSAADKRRAVELLLEHEAYSRWSDRAIADAARVHHSFVGRVRRELDGDTGAGASRVGRDGREIRTEAISSANRARTTQDYVDAGLAAEDAAAARVAGLPPEEPREDEEEGRDRDEDLGGGSSPPAGVATGHGVETARPPSSVAEIVAGAMSMLRHPAVASVSVSVSDEAPVEDEVVERDPLDRYYTPERTALACLHWLLEWCRTHLGIDPDRDLRTVIEPHVGAGAWVQALRILLPDALIDRCDLDSAALGLREPRCRLERTFTTATERAIVGDWREWPCGRGASPRTQWDLAIGNPPYSAVEIVSHVEACLARSGIAALLLRETITGASKRLTWWRDHRPAVIAKVLPRPSWEGPVARESGDLVDTVLVVWVAAKLPDTGRPLPAIGTRWDWIDVREILRSPELAEIVGVLDAEEE